MVNKFKHYSIKEILTYLDCSLCHHLEYNLKAVPPAGAFINNKNNFFKEAIYDTIAYYYTGHTNKKPPELKQLYNKFNKSWHSLNGTEQEVSILTRNPDNAGHYDRQKESTYLSTGYSLLQKFFTYNNNIKQSIIAHNYNYELPIKDAFIDGKIPLIREVEIGGRREIHLVNFSTSKKPIKLDEAKTNFNYLMNAFAFQQILNIVPDKIIVYSMHKNEETILHFSKNDYQRLFNILESFLDSIGKVKPYPTTGIHTYTTMYKELCNNYNYDLNPLRLKGE